MKCSLFPRAAALAAATILAQLCATGVAADLVGTLPGEFSVDNKGSANYSIPISIPPGRQGLQPKLSLNYSSGGGNGPLGVGFSLSTGFPQAITRGRSILARDGETRGVTFDNTKDKLYLDGKRLICVSGTYGSPGSTYRTEVDSFVSITTTGSNGNIETFIVTDKSGTKMTFGKLPGSSDGYQIGVVGGADDTLAYAYALKRVEDRTGNSVSLVYATESLKGESVLTQIEYTANLDLSVAAKHRIVLSYSSNRTDKTFSYISGRRFSHDKRLDSIAVSAEGSECARFTLEYRNSPETGRTQLVSVKQEARENASAAWQALPLTTVEWSQANIGSVSATSQELPVPAVNEWGYRENAWGDFDGDGKEDYAIVVNGGITVYRSTGKSTPGEQFAASVWMSSLPTGFVAGSTTLIVADLNGDGRKDLLLGRSNGGPGGAVGVGRLPVVPCCSTGTSFLPSNVFQLDKPSRTWFTVDPKDPNNDLWILLEKVAGGVFARLIPADYDGDGKEEILVHAYDGFRYLLRFNAVSNQLEAGPAMNAGAAGKTPSASFWLSGWPYDPLSISSGSSGSIPHMDIDYPLDIRPMPCDLDGDGVSDYLWEDKSNCIVPSIGTHSSTREWFAAKSNGQGSASPADSYSFMGIGASSAGGPLRNDADTVEGYTQLFFPADFNGDGITDFLVRNRGTNGWTLRIGTGRVGDHNIPITEDHQGALGRTFSANGETLYTVARIMSKMIWDGNFQNCVDMDNPWSTRALARIQADSSASTMVLDVNQDGMADLVWYVESRKLNSDPADARDTYASETNKGWWCALSTGAGFAAPKRLFDSAFARAPKPYGFTGQDMSSTSVSNPDLNGDGLPDWVFSTSQFNGNNLTSYAYNTGGFGDLVRSVTDGLGRKTEIVYKAAKDDSVYTPGAAVSYPIREIRGSNPVVAEVYKDSGSTDTANRAHFSYQYSGNRLDLSGRGALGFHSFVTLDRQTNLFKYQFLAQSFPMTGLTAREQTYRYWEEGSDVKFRLVNSHDNTVVFDEVVNPANSTAWGTVYPFISKAIEYRWEDSTAAHFTYTKAGSPESKPEALFTAARPAGHHIAISAESLFDNQTAVQTTIPGAYKASDRTADWASAGTNTVTGSTGYSTFHALSFARKITYGNLKKLTTNFGDGFTETIDTAYYEPADVGGLTGLVKDVTTTTGSTAFGTETAPIKRYTYWQKGTTWTPLPATEKVDATDNALDLTTTYTRDNLGRVTKTEITGTDLNSNSSVLGSTSDSAKAQHIGFFTTAKNTAFDSKWDQPTSSENAYGHTTTVAYHAFLGLPTSVKDANNAEVTTTYDALGRTLVVTDVLKNLTTTNEYAWTLASASDWKKTVTVTPPSGVTGVGPGAPITGVSAITASSVYAIRTTATVQPPVTAYYDRLGRVIRTVKEGFAGQQAVTDTVYNTLGQTIATSLPYSAGTTAANILWTKTTYDALGRVATVTAPNGTVTTNAYNGRCTTVTVDATDRDPQSNTTYVDAKGRTIKVWNADNAPSSLDPSTGSSTTASIEYKLDGFGRMRETVLKDQTAHITATYDALGRQLSLNDPDKGNWTYVNNALGHVVKQTDAKGTVTLSSFDRLGRPLSRKTTETAGPVETADWYYYDFSTDSTLHTVGHIVGSADRGWIGAPQRETCSTTSVPGYGDPGTASVHYFDTKGRPYLNLNQADRKYFYTSLEYDTYSRPSSVRYFWRPAGHEDAAPSASDTPYYWNDWGYTYTYDAESYLLTLQDTASTPRTWWQADTTSGYDHLDRPVLVRKGNGHWTSRTYRATDGLLTAIKTGPTVGSTDIQNLEFSYDGLGNLTGRTGAASETFAYDALNRLKTATVNGQTAAGTIYQPNGNIDSKTEVGGATVTINGYNGAAVANPADTTAVRNLPHAVSQYTFNSQIINLKYDLNGNLLTRTGGGHTWSTKWAGFDKPRWLADTSATGTKGSEFTYNANRSRVVHLEFDAMSAGAPSHYARKKVYGLGPQLEADYANATSTGAPDWKLQKIRIYVPGPEGIVGTMEFNPRQSFDKAETALVYHYDHLGSIERITPYGSASTSGYALDGAGKQSRYSYDAWGQRRDPDDWSGAPATTADGGSDDASPRGFTGHEMLDDLGLVHMNGRIYDALLGRFLSADVEVQDPANLQAYNRYSYVLNNPLRYTDPTGFNAEEDKKKQQEEQEKAREAAESAARRALISEYGVLGYIALGGSDIAAQAGAAAAASVAARQAQAKDTPSTDRSDNAAPASGPSDTVKSDTSVQAEGKKGDGGTTEKSGSNKDTKGGGFWRKAGEILSDIAHGVGEGDALGSGPVMVEGKDQVYDMSNPANQLGMLASSTGGVLGGPGFSLLNEAKALSTTAAVLNATKADARLAIQALKLPEAQAAAVRSAISRATTTSTVTVLRRGTDVIVRIVRPGRDGYQVMESIVSQSGTKTVVQKAFNAAGELVHNDPKLK